MTATFTAPPIEQVAPTIQTRVKEGDLKGAQNLMLGLGAAMLIGSCAVGMTSSTEHGRFAFSYLTAFMFTLGIQLGALVFTLIQHITRAGWSVAMRRVAETRARTGATIAREATSDHNTRTPMVTAMAISRTCSKRWRISHPFHW